MTEQSNPMLLALDEARKALSKGDLPVGAVLTVAGRVIASERNRIISGKSLVAHAESLLLTSHSQFLFQLNRGEVVIYTTLEPCMMCLSTAVHSRVKKIIYACRDPHGGGSTTKPLEGWYEQNWPELVHDPAYERGAAEMLITFARSHPLWLERFKGLVEKPILRQE